MTRPKTQGSPQAGWQPRKQPSLQAAGTEKRLKFTCFSGKKLTSMTLPRAGQQQSTSWSANSAGHSPKFCWLCVCVGVSLIALCQGHVADESLESMFLRLTGGGYSLCLEDSWEFRSHRPAMEAIPEAISEAPGPAPPVAKELEFGRYHYRNPMVQALRYAWMHLWSTTGSHRHRRRLACNGVGKSWA